jgi:hypothetical protein
LITIACCLWDANDQSFSFSRCYDETWVEKLYRGFARNLTQAFRFVVFTDREREFYEPIEQERISQDSPGYSACLEPYRLNAPMILVGLDTVITGNVDHLARHALATKRLAVPRDPFVPDTVCNGVALAPAGYDWLWIEKGGDNDMETIRSLYRDDKVDVIDDLFPGQVVSYKGAAREQGLGDARIVYFHGPEKPHEIGYANDWIREHWI